MYSLQYEVPKVVKGLSSMHFTVKAWEEIAISEDKQALEDYAKKALTDKHVYQIVPR